MQMFGRNLPHQDRREFPRSILSTAVEVHTPAGVRRGSIADLSRSGMRIDLARPPAMGAPVLIKWADHEAIGEVVWVQANACGVRFDRPLSEGMVERTEASVRRTGPAASVSNIQSGRRRTASWKSAN